ncbi:hypothetical protein C8J56DRAFT_889654 [Mycena floridula]|nr:hypothetical protein C8J56DRAFT_889654 [Mycena floridula]
MSFKRGLITRWATAVVHWRLRCFSELPFNGVDDIAAEHIPPNDASIAWTFSDHAVDVQRFRARFNPQWLRARLDQGDGLPSLADLSDSDEGPCDSDSDDSSDDGMPPLIDLSDSDSGYESN